MPSTSEAEAVLDLALPLLEGAAGAPVEGMVGDADPLAAVQDAVNVQGFDEIIISTAQPTRVSRWLHLDLPSKISGLGLPVTTVQAGGRGRLGVVLQSGLSFSSSSRTRTPSPARATSAPTAR